MSGFFDSKAVFISCKCFLCSSSVVRGKDQILIVSFVGAVVDDTVVVEVVVVVVGTVVVTTDVVGTVVVVETVVAVVVVAVDVLTEVTVSAGFVAKYNVAPPRTIIAAPTPAYKNFLLSTFFGSADISFSIRTVRRTWI
jgi:hypothetical protein